MRISEITSPAIDWNLQTYAGDEIVWVDAEKLRASWEKDRYFYIDGPQHPNAVKGRIERFGEWIKQGVPVKVSEIALTDDGEVTFINGRHRFVWMLQNGVKRLPVAVPTEIAIEVRSRFGI